MTRVVANPVVILFLASVVSFCAFLDRAIFPLLLLCLFVVLLTFRWSAVGDLRRLAGFWAFGVAGLCLFYAVHWPRFTINFADEIFLFYFRRLAVLFSVFSMLAVSIDRDVLFANLIALRIPAVIIFVIFRAFGSLATLRERSRSVLVAQKLRGLRIDGRFRRWKALISSFSALLNSMFVELEPAALAAESRGLLLPGKKVPFRRAELTAVDGLLLLALIAALLWDGRL